MYQQAFEDVYLGRILRGGERGGFYSTKKLGAYGADLGAVVCFFDPPWCRVTPKLSAANQASLLNIAAFNLRALGRPKEALEPMRPGLEMLIEREDWKSAAASVNNLSTLKLTLGEVTEAQRAAEQSVTFADRCKDQVYQMAFRTTHGDALHQSGREDTARDRYVEAEIIQRENQPECPRLCSLWGFRYCELLLSGS